VYLPAHQLPLPLNFAELAPTDDPILDLYPEVDTDVLYWPSFDLIETDIQIVLEESSDEGKPHSLSIHGRGPG
jgi:hypothetical protein